jgi:hypothetical protein
MFEELKGMLMNKGLMLERQYFMLRYDFHLRESLYIASISNLSQHDIYAKAFHMRRARSSLGRNGRSMAASQASETEERNLYQCVNLMISN